MKPLRESPGVKPNAEKAALGALVKIGPLKRAFIAMFQAVSYPLVRLVETVTAAKPVSGKVDSILVLQAWQLGDALLILPFLRNLRLHFPEARICLLASDVVKKTLENQGVADEWITVKLPWVQSHSRWKKYNPFSHLWIDLWQILSAVRRRKFDLAMYGGIDVRDNFLLWLTQANRRVSYGFAGGSFFLTDPVTPDLVNVHRVDIWLNLIKHLGLPVVQHEADFRLTEEQQEFRRSRCRELGISEDEFVVGIHPGARIPLRKWGNENFAEVARALGSCKNIKILWFLGPYEEYQETGVDPAIISYVQLPLSQFMGMLSRCDLLICNDSGPMHMACAMGVPAVAVFGPQEPAWYGPTGKNSRAVYRPEFWCRPCSDYCIFDEPYCLRSVTPQMVVSAASNVIDEVGNPRTKATEVRET